MSQVIENFGSYIKNLRERKKLSLEELAARTKISLQYLAALEENRLDELPSKTHVRLFLRAYLHQLGEDLDVLTNKFKEIEMTEEFRYKPKPIVKKSRYLDVILVAGGLLLVLIILWEVFKKSPEKSTTTQSNQAEIGLPLREAVPIQPGTAETLTAAVTTPAVEQKLILRLEATGKSWAEIIADGKTVHYDFLNPNQKKEWSAKNGFIITLGNPEAVSGFINTQKLKPLASRANKPVIDLRINFENYKSFLEEKKAQ
ncbi:MAG TPA: helix-turn-helix domain-containing protein [candidate division Zixibacteria bacterium]|nr:helix-turn-helix domain-containing protein [candidate division Zixibacteria bacterium]